MQNNNDILSRGKGLLGFGLEGGVSLIPWDPYPLLRVILAENSTRSFEAKTIKFCPKFAIFKANVLFKSSK